MILDLQTFSIMCHILLSRLYRKRKKEEKGDTHKHKEREKEEKKDYKKLKIVKQVVKFRCHCLLTFDFSTNVVTNSITVKRKWQK